MPLATSQWAITSNLMLEICFEVFEVIEDSSLITLSQLIN